MCLWTGGDWISTPRQTKTYRQGEEQTEDIQETQGRGRRARNTGNEGDTQPSHDTH